MGDFVALSKIEKVVRAREKVRQILLIDPSAPVKRRARQSIGKDEVVQETFKASLRMVLAKEVAGDSALLLQALAAKLGVLFLLLGTYSMSYVDGLVRGFAKKLIEYRFWVEMGLSYE
jgi:hypothetical protein